MIPKPVYSIQKQICVDIKIIIYLCNHFLLQIYAVVLENKFQCDYTYQFFFIYSPPQCHIPLLKVHTPSSRLLRSRNYPSFTAPQVTHPSFTVPQVTYPSFKAPQVTYPSFTASKVTHPSFTAPSVTYPSFKAPQVTNPSFTVPEVTYPSFMAPQATYHSFKAPQVTYPPSQFLGNPFTP